MGILFDKPPAAGDPLATISASALRDLDEILSNLDVFNGHIEKNGNRWTIVVDEPEHEESSRARRPFAIYQSGSNAWSMAAGTCWWWDAVNGEWDDAALGGSLGDIRGQGVYAKLVISGGSATWTKEASASNLMNSTTDTTRYYRIASVASDGKVSQYIDADIYETRGS